MWHNNKNVKMNILSKLIDQMYLFILILQCPERPLN